MIVISIQVIFDTSMKSSFLLVFASLLISAEAVSQGDAYFVKQTNQIFYADKKNWSIHPAKKDKNIKPDQLQVLQEKQQLLSEKNLGSPLFYNGWTEGVFRLSGGQEIRGRMALDIAGNVLFYKEMHQNSILSLKPVFISIYGHQLYRLDKQYLNAGDFYYEKMKDSGLTLLKKYSCKYDYLGKNVHSGYNYVNSNGYEGEFIKDTGFFLGQGKELHLICNKKKFYRIFGEKSQAIEKYVSDEQLDLNTEKDVLALVSYLEKN